jgi:cation diffusion facilitator CzcD-associated flavoprotein CzcO
MILGAGPTGLAAAAKCVARGVDFLLLEAGPKPAWSVRSWSHVQLFSPWGECMDSDAIELLADHGWSPPDPDAHPSGADLVEHYLNPLAAHPALSSRTLLGTRIIGYARHGIDKQVAAGRFERPFVVHRDGGNPLLGRAIIDATGSFATPRALPVVGSPAGADRIVQGIPDFRQPHVAAAISGKRVLVIGAGHSGMTVILSLLALSPSQAAAKIVWICRSPRPPGGKSYPAGSARGALEARAHAAAADARVRVVGGLSVASLAADVGGVAAIGEDAEGRPVSVEGDLAIVSTGYRPDLSLGAELWLAADPRWEAPVGLADLIDPERHSCNSVPAHGAAELAHPERDFFIAGVKSYGRAPNFALTTGYAQLDSILDHLQGKKVAPPRPAAGRSVDGASKL